MVITFGTLSLGVLIGIFVAYFIFEIEKMDRGALFSAVGVLGGAGVVALFHVLGGLHSENRPEYWFYPIGLLFGFVIGTIEEWINPPQIWDAKLKKRIERIEGQELALMSSIQIWAFIVTLLAAVLGALWGTSKFYDLSEKRAWLDCIKEADQTSAQNMVCRSQYPDEYQLFLKEFEGNPQK
jgi:hypothetical protein